MSSERDQALQWECGCSCRSEHNGLFGLDACEYHQPLLSLITPRADDYSLKTSEPFLADSYGIK